MADEKKNSQLVAALREGIAVVQMVLFKELRTSLTQRQAGDTPKEIAMLAGAVVNEVFGSHNPEPEFASFRQQQRAKVEQEMLALRDNVAALCPYLTDALRIQILCDQHENLDSSGLLLMAKSFGYLQEEREIPLPSRFMTLVRELGKANNLIIPPSQIDPEQDLSIVN